MESQALMEGYAGDGTIADTYAVCLSPPTRSLGSGCPFARRHLHSNPKSAPAGRSLRAFVSSDAAFDIHYVDANGAEISPDAAIAKKK